jgi:3-dehydroquinate synthase
LGHAIEQTSGFTVTHGAAVGLGILLITRLAQAQYWCGPEVLPRLTAALARNGLPTDCPYPIQALFTALAQDKKRVNSGITIVTPAKIGSCELRSMTMIELRVQLEAALCKGK